MKPSLESLIEALRTSWASDTCYDASEWSEDNPARGQCVVSSLVVQHYLGGELLRYRVSGEDIQETHYCNILPSGVVVDTTFSQYRQPVVLTVAPIDLSGYASAREKRLAEAETCQRYELLLGRVKSKLQ